MRRLLYASIALLVTAAPAAAAAPKSITITYAASAGHELDTINGTFASPLCNGKLSATQEIRDIAWRVKWKRVAVPRPGRTVTALAPTEFTGSGRIDTDVKADASCGELPPPTHCTGQLRVTGPTQLQLRWTGKGAKRRLAIEVSALNGDSLGEEEAEDSGEQQDECRLEVRTAAFDASLTAPRTSRRPVVLRRAASDNAGAEDESRRPHTEQHEAGDGFRMDSVSDVSWEAVVAVRYNRLR